MIMKKKYKEYIEVFVSIYYYLNIFYFSEYSFLLCSNPLSSLVYYNLLNYEWGEQ